MPRSQAKPDPVEATLQPIHEASGELEPRFNATWAAPAVPGDVSVIQPAPCDQVDASVGEDATEVENDPLVPGFWIWLPSAMLPLLSAAPVQVSDVLITRPVPFQTIAVTGRRSASKSEP